MESFEVMRGAGHGNPGRGDSRHQRYGGRGFAARYERDIFTDDGQVSMPRVLAQVALHPAVDSGLMRLGRNSKRAAESLGEFLDSCTCSG